MVTTILLVLVTLIALYFIYANLKSNEDLNELSEEYIKLSLKLVEEKNKTGKYEQNNRFQLHYHKKWNTIRRQTLTWVVSETNLTRSMIHSQEKRLEVAYKKRKNK